MESVAARFSSPRFQRYLLWIGVAVFVIGAAVLTFTLVGGTDGSPAKPDKGFHPTLPAKSVPLRNSDGVTVRTFTQLDPAIRLRVVSGLSHLAPLIAPAPLAEAILATSPSP